MIREFKRGYWYPHTGGPKPRYLEYGFVVEYMMRRGNKDTRRVVSLTWEWDAVDTNKEIIAFKVVKQ